MVLTEVKGAFKFSEPSDEYQFQISINDPWARTTFEIGSATIIVADAVLQVP